MISNMKYIPICLFMGASGCNHVPATQTPDPDALTAAVSPIEEQDEILIAISNEMRAAESGDGISNAQDFDDVSVRMSIRSDAEHLKQLKSERVVFLPLPLPEAPEAGGVAEYALITDHPRGTPVHDRLTFGSTQFLAAKCSRYFDAHEAQRAFLSSGGPGRDRMGLDPDGDGYACNWDPGLFRSMLR